MSTLSTNTVKSLTTSPPAFQRSDGTEIGRLCRAWVNFNGTGTPAIRASFNVSSITDNGTGDYTVNFTTAMSDANYAAIATCRRSTLGNTAFANIVSAASALTTAGCRIGTPNDAGTAIDAEEVCAAFFR